MIGDLDTLNGIRVKLVKEENNSSCAGCYFCNDSHNCDFESEEGSYLDCGEFDGIYKKIEAEKGVKKKLTLN